MDILEIAPINLYFTHKETNKIYTHSEYMEMLNREIDNRWKEMPENIRETIYENEKAFFHACLTDFEGSHLSEWDKFEEYYPSNEQRR